MIYYGIVGANTVSVLRVLSVATSGGRAGITRPPGGDPDLDKKP